MPDWCLAFLLSSGRKILFNVSTITFPGVIYSGMLMCLESAGPCGLWHALLRVFLSSIRSGTAQALWCRCHLFKHQRLMQQESIDDPAVSQHRPSLCALLPVSLFMWWILMFANPPVDFLECLSHTVYTVFICVLHPRRWALCHALNQHHTIAGC